MQYNKILSDQFCQAAVLALRDTAVEFETANHVVYTYPPKNPLVDSFGYFIYSAYNEVRWWKSAESISKLSALYIPFYAQMRGLDPEKLSDADARRIFLYMMLAELEDSHRVTSLVNDYDTGFGYEGVLNALYAMGEEKAMQGFAKLSPEIKNLWTYGHEKYEPIDYTGMMSLKNLAIAADEQAVEVRVMMQNYLFGNLLRESLLTAEPGIAQAAFGIPWDEVMGYQIEDELKRFVEAHPNDYKDPVLACNAFFAALNAAAKAAPLMQVINKTNVDELKRQMLRLLPSYIPYFERQSYDLFHFHCALSAPPRVDSESMEIDEDSLPL